MTTVSEESVREDKRTDKQKHLLDVMQHCDTAQQM